MDIFKGKDKVEKVKIGLGDSVRITKDRLTKIPKRVVEIDVYPVGSRDGSVHVSEKNVEATFKEFFQEHKEVFKVEPEDLKLVSAKKINKRWYVKYGQYYKGIPVHNATVGLDSSENGRVGAYAANYHPDIKVSTKPKVNLEDATNKAIKTYKEKNYSKLKMKDDILIIYPEKVEDKIIYHLAWKFMIVGEELDPEIEKYFIVDALDGKIIQSYSARFPGAQVTGTVKGEIYPENPTDPISTMPIKNVYVNIKDAGQTITDNSGYYKKTVSWFWQLVNFPSGESTFTLEGPHAQVQNLGGADYTETRNCNTSDPGPNLDCRR